MLHKSQGLQRHTGAEGRATAPGDASRSEDSGQPGPREAPSSEVLATRGVQAKDGGHPAGVMVSPLLC